jgi:hypothetical protein
MPCGTDKEAFMHSITININNDKLLEKVIWLLHFRNEGLEVVLNFCKEALS